MSLGEHLKLKFNFYMEKPGVGKIILHQFSCFTFVQIRFRYKKILQSGFIKLLTIS